MSPGARALQPVDLDQARDMLGHISADDRDIWLQVGMALHSEFGAEGFDLWDEWSQRHPGYAGASCRSSWRSFRGRFGITIGTLIKLAMDAGFRFKPGSAGVPDPTETLRRRAERALQAQAQQDERERLAQAAQARARSDWRSAPREGHSAYCERKGISEPESWRFRPSESGTSLLVPMVRYDLAPDQALMGLQTISGNGSKKYSAGMAKSGCACRLGSLEPGSVVFVCEGWATGMTLRMALDRRYAVFVTFDAYNLPAAAELIHSIAPSSPMVICADDDYTTLRDGLVYNVGRVQAQGALNVVLDSTPGMRMAMRTYPVFKRTTRRGPKDSDFNDLGRLEGLGTVSEQLALCFKLLEQLKNG